MPAHSAFVCRSESSAPLLPTPTKDAGERFIQFYQKRFGVTLDMSQAQQILTGLMRFVCLTDQYAGDPFITPVSGASHATHVSNPQPAVSKTSVPLDSTPPIP